MESVTVECTPLLFNHPYNKCVFLLQKLDKIKQIFGIFKPISYEFDSHGLQQALKSCITFHKRLILFQ